MRFDRRVQGWRVGWRTGQKYPRARQRSPLRNVGGRLAELCRGLFGMRVLAYDPYLAPSRAKAMQVEGVSATVEDKLRIAEQLDHLGVHFIEGGWPGANPKDVEFFARAATELTLHNSVLVAFGSTRRPRGKSDDDATLRNLLDANTSAVCIVAKSWDYHVKEALQTTLEEGVAMVADSVDFLSTNGRRVMVDLEHFFDGYKNNPEFALKVVEAAVMKSATVFARSRSGNQ